jgi:hypothetical protein
MENLRRVKQATLEWRQVKKKQDAQDIIDIEVVLQTIYDSVAGGYISYKLKEEIIALEKKRRQLLEAREVEWNLKIWPLWLENVEIL